MKRALLIAVLLAACGGSDDSATPTTTSTSSSAATCDPNFEIPLETEQTNECKFVYLRSVAQDENMTLTDDAETQAMSLCRGIVLSGLTEGLVLAHANWETGAAPSPADDVSTFSLAAIGLYCPEYYDGLRDG